MTSTRLPFRSIRIIGTSLHLDGGIRVSIREWPSAALTMNVCEFVGESEVIAHVEILPRELALLERILGRYAEFTGARGSRRAGWYPVANLDRGYDQERDGCQDLTFVVRVCDTAAPRLYIEYHEGSETRARVRILPADVVVLRRGIAGMRHRLETRRSMATAATTTTTASATAA